MDLVMLDLFKKKYMEEFFSLLFIESKVQGQSPVEQNVSEIILENCSSLKF